MKERNPNIESPKIEPNFHLVPQTAADELRKEVGKNGGLLTAVIREEEYVGEDHELEEFLGDLVSMNKTIMEDEKSYKHYRAGWMLAHGVLRKTMGEDMPKITNEFWEKYKNFHAGEERSYTYYRDRFQKLHDKDERYLYEVLDELTSGMPGELSIQVFAGAVDIYSAIKEVGRIT